MPVITVDVHERPSGVGDLLRSLGADVETTRLRAGDYALRAGVMVERKRVLGLHKALIEGRLWRQLGQLRNACRWPYLLVEGHDLDAGPLSGSSVRGACLAAMEQRIRLIRAWDADESAQWLYRLAVRCQHPRRQRDRPAYSQRPATGHPSAAAEALLAAVPGISTYSARALLERFGTVTAVINAGPDEWTTVPGIGRHRASSLHATVSARWQSQRAQDPST